MRLHPFLCLALCAGPLLGGCDRGKEKPNDPVPVAATGSLAGTVKVQDEAGQPVNSAGVLVTLQGTAPAPPLTATTDAGGNFQFKPLPFGQYKAVYTRVGVGTWQEQNIVLDAQTPNLVRTVKLGQLASTAVTSFSLTGSSSFPNTIPYTLSMTYNAQLYPDRHFHLYFGAAADVSSTNYEGVSYGSSNQNPTRLWISLDGLALKKFASGSKVYVVAYGAPAPENQISYFANPSSRDNPMPVTTNLNPTPSAVLSFTMP